MPQMPIRKVKRPIVLTKRTQCLRKYYKERSYKPLYEKLKNNNSYLAKALTHEKENNQSLFTQNLALISEIQELRLGYNVQDNVITNVLNNAKEMLKMLVTMSGYMTNTISICQEYVSSNTTVRLSTTSNGRKDSSKRLSTKSPAKGVVKPMVSGHTITKPTINLSRVNMENINSVSRLSDITEVSTPNRSSINRSQINEDRSPIGVPMAITPFRFENDPTCRMPERLPVSSSINDTLNNEQRLKRKKNHSKKLSRSFSRLRSKRWSNESPRNSTEYISQSGIPTVKLNDVSKLLRNSHSINVKRLIHNVEVQENSNEAHHDTSERNVIIPETQASINLDEEDEVSAQTSEDDFNVQTVNKTSDKDLTRHTNITENLKPSQSNVWEEDPLEGPSWLFNNTLAVPLRDNEPEESNHLHSSDFNNNTSDIIEYDDDDSSIADNTPDELSAFNVGNLMESNNVSTLQKDVPPVSGHTEFESCLNDHDADNNLGTTLSANLSTCGRNSDNEEDDPMSLASFVTLRRAPSEIMEEESEDFTLMLTRQPVRNMHFDINELRLPTSDESVINSNVDESDAKEITRSNITNVQTSNFASNRDQDVISECDRTIKIPLINKRERISVPEKNKQSNKKNKKTGSSSVRDKTEHIENDSTMDSKAKQRNKSEKYRDPSAAKVVLEKLNESRVKQRRSMSDETESQSDNNNYMAIKNDTSNQMEGLEDTDDSTNSNTSNRPRRRRAPMNLKEPSMKKKLRRNM